ncbi:MAG: hypothetical protein E7186_08385 [Erysipelotrichaceae bacterium]|nr:hypothetical protein [Erysipelotrichaceae bacterium]
MKPGFRYRIIMNTLLSVLMIFVSFNVSALSVRAEDKTDKMIARIAGNNRYQTSFAIAQSIKEKKKTDKLENVIVASGSSFPDALGGCYLSAKLQAPILLINDDSADAVVEYIRDSIMENGKIYILGGTSAVSHEAKNKLMDIENCSVSRLNGANRYQTNLRILQECGSLGNQLLVSTGTNYADSLSASSCGLPVLLVASEGLDDSQKKLLSENKFDMITILGGSNAVSERIEKELSEFGEVRRLQGENREETSYRIAREFFPQADFAIVACSGNYPDGLCGGLLGHVYDAPILLVSDKRYEYGSDYVSNNNIQFGAVLGGTSAISNETVCHIYNCRDVDIIETQGISNIEKELRKRDYSTVKSENLEKVTAYVDKVYQDNIRDDYTVGDFTWYYDHASHSWLYTTGLMIQGFLECDIDKYSGLIKDYYDQHINDDGSIKKYIDGQLDSVITATGIIDLINSNKLTREETELYKSAVNFVYHELEKQTEYPEAGKCWQHSERNGVPTKAWTRWNICLDGIFMSQLFISRLAQSIEKGTIEVMDLEGNIVKAEDLWDDLCERMRFVMENMLSESGVLYHGYCVAEKVTNGVCWGRGNGWYAMALLEAALNCPEKYRETMRGYFRQLMDGVLNWQDDETFLWYNVIDHREEITDNIPESSVSAMLSYCLLKGYRTGLLPDEKYHLAGLRGFNAMVTDRIVEGNLINTMCSSGVSSDINRYAVNGYVDNEAKSIGALLLAIRYYK